MTVCAGAREPAPGLSARGKPLADAGSVPGPSLRPSLPRTAADGSPAQAPHVPADAGCFQDAGCPQRGACVPAEVMAVPLWP